MKRLTSTLFALLLVWGTTAQAITVAEALTIGNALEGDVATTTESYTIEGYVNVITENSFSSSYNNMTFWIADTRGTKSSSTAGALQVFRGRPDRELVVGDKIQVVAPLRKYYSTIETYGNNAPVTWLESAPDVPIPVLDTIRGNFRVCAQNLENYYYNYNTGRGNYTPEEFAAKTNKIVNMMISVDADVYAFCEVEAQPIVLAQLADSANARVEGNPYTAVSDGISVEWDSYDNNLKSGFIYRNDKVKLVGSNSAGSSAQYYRNTMRIQAFEQLSSGERLVVSMNHFKAKDSSADQGEEKRIANATSLINSLSYISTDPDILVLGDLNCEYGEAPITNIINAGYEEQILRFDSLAYSHCYGGGELIDHVLANSSMKAQIVCAYVKHVSAYKCNPNLTYADSYSDHDPYVVEINFPEPSDECQDMDATYLTSGLGDFTTDDASVWSWNSYGYAKAIKSGGVESNLFSPELNLSEMKNISLSFSHAHKFAGDPSEELTLWVTNDYKGSYDASTWQQLTIDPYTDNNSWTWKDVTIDVPKAYVGAKTVFAFHYKSTASAYGTWEIKNLHITATCDSTTAIDNTEVTAPKAFKYIENGHIYIILPDGSTYNVMGQKIQ